MDIFGEIKNILADILDLDGQTVTPESRLTQELGVESIDLLELAAALNARFKVEVREEDIFLQGFNARSAESYPFLAAQRLREIAAEQKDGAAGPVVKVKDLVSYVAWQQAKAGTHVHP